MFSLNSINTQNQILVSFSQLSARYSSVFRHRKHSYGKNKDVKRKESAALTYYDATICKESFEEALRNLDKNVIVEMKRVDIRSLASSSRISQDPQRCLSSRKISYVSADSFEKNKNGWSAQPSRRGFISFTDQFAGLLSSSIQQRGLDIQVRGFKTERGIHADLKRNPNLINRLRKFFGQYK